MAAPRLSPGQQAAARLKVQEKMTRADSLASLGEFGRIVPPSQQAALRKKKKKGFRIPILSDITDALGGK
jgi:hypothetical protein